MNRAKRERAANSPMLSMSGTRVDSEFADYCDKSEPTKPPQHYRAGLVCPTFIAAPPLLVPSSSLSAFFSHFPPFATHTRQKIPRLNARGWVAHHISCARHEWAGCCGKGEIRRQTRIHDSVEPYDASWRWKDIGHVPQLA